MTGAAVRQAREAAGLSLRSLSRSVGVSPATMSAIERGRTPLTVERLQTIAGVLNVSAARLLRGARTAQAGPDPAAGTAEAWRRYDDPGLGRVLTAALRLFVRQGFHATSMREVAAEAGLSVAGVYHHYPSKEALLVELMDRTMAEIGWRLLAARDGGGNPKQSFCLMVESLALFHAVRRDLAFLGASEMRGLSGADLARVTGLRNEVQHLIDDQAALAFPGKDVRTACRAIATMCTALPSWFRPAGPLSAEQVAREYAGLAERMCVTG
jgi:AcrR family transcriptional regulator/DNA-binding XRE family transcriptional regulator